MCKTTVWYHGTNESSAYNICNIGIDFSKSKKELDFGVGFYLTDDISVAKRRALSKTRKYNRIYHKNEKPAVVTIVIDESYFDNLTVRNFEYCNEEWLHFVLANRLPMEYLVKNNITEHNLDFKYDVVMGSIADSDVSRLATHLGNGDLTFRGISVYDVLTKEGTTLGMQMSFHTKSSLASVKSKSFETFEGRNK